MRVLCVGATVLASLTCGGVPLLPGPSASGVLIYEGDGAMSRGEFLATQAEVVESRSVREEVVARLADDAPPPLVEARPSPSGWTLGVTVSDPDPNRAAIWCNVTLEALIERAIHERLEPLARSVHWTAALLDEARAAEDAEAVERLERALREAVAAEAEARAAPLSVRVLDRCEARIPSGPPGMPVGW